MSTKKIATVTTATAAAAAAASQDTKPVEETLFEKKPVVSLDGLERRLDEDDEDDRGDDYYDDDLESGDYDDEEDEDEGKDKSSQRKQHCADGMSSRVTLDLDRDDDLYADDDKPEWRQLETEPAFGAGYHGLRQVGGTARIGSNDPLAVASSVGVVVAFVALLALVVIRRR